MDVPNRTFPSILHVFNFCDWFRLAPAGGIRVNLRGLAKILKIGVRESSR